MGFFYKSRRLQKPETDCLTFFEFKWGSKLVEHGDYVKVRGVARKMRFISAIREIGKETVIECENGREVSYFNIADLKMVWSKK